MKISHEDIFSKFCILNNVPESETSKVKIVIEMVLGDVKNYLQYHFDENLPIALENTVLLIIQEYAQIMLPEISGNEIKSIDRGDTKITYNTPNIDTAKSILKKYAHSLNAFRRIKLV